jgi:secretion/DNA translocation related TadE-like protein
MRVCRSDEGAGSVLVLTVIALLSSLGLAALSVVTGYAERQRLATLADLAALTAARVVQAEPARACAVAERVADSHGVFLRGCGIDGVDVVVEVEAPGPWGITLVGRARAQPVWV